MLGEPGSSAFMFEHKGVVSVSRENIPDESDPMELAIEVSSARGCVIVPSCFDHGLSLITSVLSA